MWASAYSGFTLQAAGTTITTTSQQTGVDISSYIGMLSREIVVWVSVGTLTTTTTATVAVTECATSGGTYAAPPAGTASAVVTAAGLTKLHFHASKSFLRAEVTVNATGSIPITFIGMALAREAS